MLNTCVLVIFVAGIVMQNGANYPYPYSPPPPYPADMAFNCGPTHPSAPLQTAWNEPPPFGQPMAAPPYQQPAYGTPYYGAAPPPPPPFIQPPQPPPQQQQQQQVMVVNGGQSRPIVVQAQSFCGHMTLACFVFWCCNPLFGLIAFILAGQFIEFPHIFPTR